MASLKLKELKNSSKSSWIKDLSTLVHHLWELRCCSWGRRTDQCGCALTITNWTRWRSRISILCQGLTICWISCMGCTCFLRSICSQAITKWGWRKRARYGHYEFLIMSFGLTNALAVFMDTMNKVFHDYLDQFIIIFIDDILIYLKTLKKHGEHLWKALERLWREQLYAKLKKCGFWLDNVSFIGHMISRENVAVNLEKVKVVL